MKLLHPAVGTRRYRCRSTGHSSARYGPCEVCRQHCPEVFIQSEQAFFRWFEVEGGPERFGWTFHRCTSHRFGHEACLVSVRQTGPV